MRIFSTQIHKVIPDAIVKPQVEYEWVIKDAIHTSAKSSLFRTHDTRSKEVIPQAAPFVDGDGEREFCAAAGEARECRSRCEYGASCPRKLFARREAYGPLDELRYVQVLPVKGKGLGLVTVDHIAKNQPICAYVGMRFGTKHANKRSLMLVQHGITTYHMTKTGTASSDAVVEATIVGGAFRFVNHGCGEAANAYCQYWNTGGADGTMVLCAKRHIAPETEIVYNYGCTLDDEDLIAMDHFGQGTKWIVNDVSN